MSSAQKKPTTKKSIILKVALVIIAIMMIRFYQQQELTIGTAPTFVSKNLLGESIEFPNNDNSKATLVHFWATWCGICAIENDNIQKIIKTRDYSVLNIAWQSGSDTSLIQYAKTHNLDLATIINDQYGTLTKVYGVKATPTSFIIDKSGNIIFTEVGYTTELGLKLRLWWASR